MPEEAVVEETPDTIPIDEHRSAVSDLQSQVENLSRAQKFIGTDGNFTDDWTQYLPEDLREAPFTKKFKSLPGFLKSYQSMESIIGKSTKPDDTWDKEQLDDWYEANLDIPKDAEAYKVPEEIENMPEGIERNEAAEQEWMQFAHQNRIKPDVAHKAIEWFMGTQGKQLEMLIEQQQAQATQNEVELENEIGAKGILTATKAANYLSEKTGLDLLADPVLANHPAAIKMLNWIGANVIGEKNLPKHESEVTLGDAEAEIEDVMNNPNNPYYKGYRGEASESQNKRAQAHMEKLFDIRVKRRQQ